MCTGTAHGRHESSNRSGFLVRDERIVVGTLLQQSRTEMEVGHGKRRIQFEGVVSHASASLVGHAKSGVM